MLRLANKSSDVFQADAYVIEEQAEHIVVALRVSRDYVRRNMNFLAAVADMTAPQTPREARPFVLPNFGYAEASNRIKAATLALVIGALVIGALGIGFAGVVTFATATAKPEPPIRVVSADLVKSVVAADEPLQVRFISQRTRLCATELERTWLNDRGQTIHIGRQQGIGQAVTSEAIERIIPVPQPFGLGVGKYTYRSVIYSTCGADFYATASGDLAYEVR
jgi:hypothetical protein